jgi:hypothetical protein
MDFYSVPFRLTSIRGDILLRCSAAVYFLKLSVKLNSYTVERDEFK